jgi:hypothetical protein
VSAPGFGRGHRLSQTSRLDASINLAFEAAATGRWILLSTLTPLGTAVAHANLQEHHRMVWSQRRNFVRFALWDTNGLDMGLRRN